MSGVSIFVAFAAGLVSFASPCVLPIIPGFLAYVSGASRGEGTKRLDFFLASLFFVLGFSIVFSVLGVLLNTLLSGVAYSVQSALSKIGGTIIIAFGLYLAGLLSIPWLSKSHTMRVSAKRHSRYVTSFLFGFAFAAGWTPCVGAVLGAIIALAASNPGSAFFLLLSYSIGLGIPFIAVGLFASAAQRFIDRHVGGFAILSKVFGVALVALGILVFTDRLSSIASLPILNSILLN